MRFEPCPDCCGSCIIFSDAFDRDDSTDLGLDWEEIDGDWEILDNTLTINEANALVRCTVAGDSPTHSYTVRASVYAGDSGDKMRLLIDCNEDATYYHYLEIEFGDPGTSGSGCYRGYIRLGRHDHGDETILTAQTVDTLFARVWYDAYVCIEGEPGTSGVSSGEDDQYNVLVGAVAGQRVWVEDVTPQYDYGGLGTGDTIGSQVSSGEEDALSHFDDYAFWRHQNDLGGCPDCLLPIVHESCTYISYYGAPHSFCDVCTGELNSEDWIGNLGAWECVDTPEPAPWGLRTTSGGLLWSTRPNPDGFNMSYANATFYGTGTNGALLPGDVCRLYVCGYYLQATRTGVTDSRISWVLKHESGATVRAWNGYAITGSGTMGAGYGPLFLHLCVGSCAVNGDVVVNGLSIGFANSILQVRGSGSHPRVGFGAWPSGSGHITAALSASLTEESNTEENQLDCPWCGAVGCWLWSLCDSPPTTLTVEMDANLVTNPGKTCQCEQFTGEFDCPHSGLTLQCWQDKFGWKYYSDTLLAPCSGGVASILLGVAVSTATTSRLVATVIAPGREARYRSEEATEIALLGREIALTKYYDWAHPSGRCGGTFPDYIIARY